MRQLAPAFHRPQLVNVPNNRKPQLPSLAPATDFFTFRSTHSLDEVRILVSSLQYSAHSTSAAMRFTNSQLATMRFRLRALMVHLAVATKLDAITDDEVSFITQLEQELNL